MGLEYAGHTPTTVAERHYFGDKKGRMVEVFREHVSSKVDGVIDRIKGGKWHNRLSWCHFFRDL
ncbi:MAG: hypothetical protein IPI28_13090 [Candidatus Omnitrophica bacterium]|nr:hypothetical protein [Candidatus Omnitrophota bacterium]